jgi:hypothetical protein
MQSMPITNDVVGGFMVLNVTFNNNKSYFVAVNFIGGGIWSTQRKPTTCH